jgi:hypothetical protein
MFALEGVYTMKSSLLLCSLFIALVRGSALAADNRLTKEEAKQGWILLFDGKTLDGWMTSDSKPSQRPVEDGMMNPHKSGAYMLVTKKEFGDFKLQLDFKLSPGCNSGVFFRVFSLTPRPGKDVGYNGIEVAIDDTKTAGYVDTGAIYDLSKPTKNTLRPLGEWNHLVLTSQDNGAVVRLNGEVVNNVDFNKFTKSDKRPDATPHKFGVAYKDFPRRGRIGLQDHGADIWFKNIKLLPLGESKSAGGAASVRRLRAVCRRATMP